MHNPIGFVLITDQSQIDNLLAEFKTEDDINVKKLQEFFGHKTEREGTKITKIVSPEFYTSDEFILKKGTLPNVKEDIQTSIGLYIFNLFCVSSVFGETINYFNPDEGLNPGNIEGLQQIIVDSILENKVTGKQFGTFQTRASWLGYKGTLWTPGQSFDFTKVNPEVAKAKPKLIEEWKRSVEEKGMDPAASYAVMVEKPLLDIAKKDLKNNQSWPIYARGGKPKWGNMYKNCTISMGPVHDPITGKFIIATNSFMEGIENEMVPTFTNIQVDAAFSRACATQDGGAKTKQIFSAMQSIKLNEKRESDCGSKGYVKKIITKKNFHKNYMRYIIEKDGSLVKLTNENFKKYEGKEVKMRSPLFCKSGSYCNKCAGDYFYEIGMPNVGTSVTRLSSTLMNKALKNMHDVSVKAAFVDPFDYMIVTKK